jgi:hypothetical protein
MQQEALAKEALTSLLKEAEKAHAEYEYALGQRDPDWASWYARFIIDRLQNDIGIASPEPTQRMTDGQPHSHPPCPARSPLRATPTGPGTAAHALLGPRRVW